MNSDSYLIKKYKILLADDEKIIASKGYRLFVSYDSGISWQYWNKLEWNKFSPYTYIRILARLTRSEIHAMYPLPNGDHLCIAKKGIFKLDPGSSKFKKVHQIIRGSRPLHLAIDKDEHLYFGEYFSNGKRGPVNIYFSSDHGNKWDIIHTFPSNSIRHIHGLFYDKFGDKIWITTGDEEGECIIGFTEDKFETIKELFKGGQDYRAVKLLFFKDYILYGTDSPLMKNKIYKIDRMTNKLEMVFTVQGSVINATQIDDFAFFSTTVEPSSVNTDKHSYIWQYDGKNDWKCIASYEKDCWNMFLFQFGSIQFPVNDSTDHCLYFSGHSLKGIDGHSMAISIT